MITALMVAFGKNEFWKYTYEIAKILFRPYYYYQNLDFCFNNSVSRCDKYNYDIIDHERVSRREKEWKLLWKKCNVSVLFIEYKESMP